MSFQPPQKPSASSLAQAFLASSIDETIAGNIQKSALNHGADFFSVEDMNPLDPKYDEMLEKADKAVMADYPVLGKPVDGTVKNLLDLAIVELKIRSNQNPAPPRGLVENLSQLAQALDSLAAGKSLNGVITTNPKTKKTVKPEDFIIYGHQIFDDLNSYYSDLAEKKYDKQGLAQKIDGDQIAHNAAFSKTSQDFEKVRLTYIIEEQAKTHGKS